MIQSLGPWVSYSELVYLAEFASPTPYCAESRAAEQIPATAEIIDPDTGEIRA